MRSAFKTILIFFSLSSIVTFSAAVDCPTADKNGSPLVAPGTDAGDGFSKEILLHKFCDYDTKKDSISYMHVSGFWRMYIFRAGEYVIASIMHPLIMLHRTENFRLDPVLAPKALLKDREQQQVARSSRLAQLVSRLPLQRLQLRLK